MSHHHADVLVEHALKHGRRFVLWRCDLVDGELRTRSTRRFPS